VATRSQAGPWRLPACPPAVRQGRGEIWPEAVHAAPPDSLAVDGVGEPRRARGARRHPARLSAPANPAKHARAGVRNAAAVPGARWRPFILLLRSLRVIPRAGGRLQCRCVARPSRGVRAATGPPAAVVIAGHGAHWCTRRAGLLPRRLAFRGRACQVCANRDADCDLAAAGTELENDGRADLGRGQEKRVPSRGHARPAARGPRGRDSEPESAAVAANSPAQTLTPQNAHACLHAPRGRAVLVATRTSVGGGGCYHGHGAARRHRGGGYRDCPP
jgi:hypothetical protein